MTNQYKLRLNVIFLFFLLFYGALCVNLYIIQVKQNSFFKAMAQNQYATIISTSPPRALILDRNSKPLALNITRLTAFIIPSKITEPEKLRAFLSEHYPQARTRLDENPELHFMYVKRHLSEQEIDNIEKSGLKDIKFLKEPHRYYPVESVGPLVGITDTDNKGLMGIESYLNDVLAGTPSTYFLEQEARSGHYYFHKETQVQGTEGSPVTLTLDANLQFLAYAELKEAVKRLKAVDGAVLILDPVTSDILVMAHYPDFDENHHESLDLEKTKNKIVTETYELGSVMKVFLALAALDEGVVTPDEIIDCENKLVTYIDRQRIGTTKPNGLLTFSQVIELSNNIGTSKIAQRLGPKLYDHYVRCGFGQKTGLNFPGEQKGFVSPPSSWSKASIFSLSFGYESRATLLQLARAFAIIATGGRLISPRLILEPQQPPQMPSAPLYKPDTIKTMREILTRTITQGTAHRAKIDGYTVLGKTGTANLITNGTYDPTRTIFSFAGLIEKDDYKRIIVTFLREVPQRTAYAATVAVPLFERIAHKMLINDKVI
jgi:cell division protein FtsI (penicillin-binding protein 3)